MAFLSGGFLDALPTSKVRALLPLQPVVREGQGSLALPARGVFAKGNMGTFYLIEIQFWIRAV